MRDVILIGAYCNTLEKEKILRDLLQSIDRSIFDLVIFSHLPTPIDIQQMCNYFFYDHENELIPDYDLKTQFWLQIGDKKLNTTEFQDKNTFIPVFRQLVIGLSLCKSLGYDKVHYLEYDCKMKSSQELIDNSKLLNEHSCVFYTESGLVESLAYFPLISINTKMISSELTNFCVESISNWLKQSEIKAPEFKLREILTSGANFYIKKKESLTANGIESGLTYNDDLFMISPFYNTGDQEVNLISYSSNYETFDFSVFLNDLKLSTYTLNKNEWFIIPISKKENLKKITISINNLVYRIYDFEKIDMETYLNRNYM